MLSRIKEKFGPRLLKVFEKSPKRIYIDIDARDLLEIAGFIFKDLGARFITATGVDNMDSLEILYHFSFDGQNQIVNLRVKLGRNKPEIKSLTGIIKGASWIEREMYELLGINFIGHPNLKRLLLDDDWPEGKFPLRKDYA